MDSGVILRRRPIWRSAELNAFLDTLDVRANKASRTPRKERQLGSPLRSIFPDEKTTLSPDELVCFFVSFTYTFHVSLNVLLFNHLCLYEWPGNEDVVGLLLLNNT